MTSVQLQHHEIMIDCEPVIVVAGEIHYFRLPVAQWLPRLQLLKEAGANTVATYVPWVVHERGNGAIDVTDVTDATLDVGRFIDLAAELELYVILRPGPFIMAEMANEGIPDRVRIEHPEILPIGWEGRPAPTGDIDYLAPTFLNEVQNWYAALGAVISPRMAPQGGPIIGVQLDNEVGMLAWVANAPQLTTRACTEFAHWLQMEYGAELNNRYPGLSWQTEKFCAEIRSPKAAWARALRLDLGKFSRLQFAKYIELLAGFATNAGMGGVPFFINIHGTDRGAATTFPIGISQLFESYQNIPQFAAGSDHYLGEMNLNTAADLHLINAYLAAVNGPDQPLTSLEFEAGNGDYGDDLARDVEPSAVVLKTRLSLAQGARLLNYYLFSGGTNFVADPPRSDGTTRFGITGERHGFAAPITPEGERGPAYESTAESMQIAGELAPLLVDSVSEHDNVGLAMVLDDYLTEYRPPTESPVHSEDLAYARGLGPRAIAGRMLLTLGYRYGAVDLQNSQQELPKVIVLGSPNAMDKQVQQRLVTHLENGGSLLLLGEIPFTELDGTPCTLLAQALGIAAVTEMRDGHGNFLSVIPKWGRGTERRVGRMQLLDLAPGFSGSQEAILHDAISGKTCGLLVRPSSGGAAVIVGCDFGYDFGFWETALTELGAQLGLNREPIPGLITLTTKSPTAHLLHAINVSPREVKSRFTLDGHDLFNGNTISIPARSGIVKDLSE